MKIAKKISLIVAIALIAAGLLLALAALALLRFDVTALRLPQTTTSYTIGEPFRVLRIEGTSCGIRLAPAEDGVCRVDCVGSKYEVYTAAVEDGTLTVRQSDGRRWYEHIGFFSAPAEVTVYLPQCAYDRVTAVTSSGDIAVPAGFTFVEAELRSTSGSVTCAADAAANLTVQSVSGDLTVSSIVPALQAETTSGAITLTDVECGSATVGTTSGDCVLRNVVAQDTLQISSVSGSITLTDCDALALFLESTSGDIGGSLRSRKDFAASTVSGDVDVPAGGGSGMTCEVSTVSGDIRFTAGA